MSETGKRGKPEETRGNGAIIFVYYFLALSFEQLNYKSVKPLDHKYLYICEFKI